MLSTIGVLGVILSPSLVILNPSPVILSEAKDLFQFLLRVNSAKGLFHFEMLGFFAGAQNDSRKTAVIDRRYSP